MQWTRMRLVEGEKEGEREEGDRIQRIQKENIWVYSIIKSKITMHRPSYIGFQLT